MASASSTSHSGGSADRNRKGVFISYSRKDGAAFAKKLRRRLEKEGFPLWQDRVGLEGGRDWWQQIQEALDHVEYMALVMTPEALKSPIIKKEWRYARQQGVCVFPVKGVSDEKLDYAAMPRWMSSAHFVETDDPDEWQKFLNDLRRTCQIPRVPFMVEDLAEDFVERPREFEQLINKLLDTGREEPVAITAALRGAGGYGKTTLARALCHEERIQQAFDDGILWVTLGENPGDLTPKVLDLIEVLSGERPGFAEIQPATARLAELLAERDILLVIDDVWNAAHARPFLQGGKNCARLITTRNSDTLPPKAEQINLDAMQQSEALQLLGAALPPGGETALQTLASRLGEWPLLLKLANSQLRIRVNEQKQSLDDALAYVNKALDKRGLTAFDPRDAAERSQAAGKTLSVSLELLNEAERARYNELAIFPEDADIPLKTVEKLWQAAGCDELDTEELCQRFFRLSLLLQLDLQTRSLRLHDVLRTYLRQQQRETLPDTQTRFLQAYKPENWWELPPQEPYLWQHLAYHLKESGREETLRRLLLDFRWLAGKLAAAGVNALLADYDFLPEEGDLRPLQSALRLSANPLTRDAAQLPGQLLGRLAALPTGAFAALLQQAKTLPNYPWLRPLFAALTPPGGPLQRTLEGHSGGVNSVALSADGKRALSGSSDNTLKLWDLQSGEALQTLEGHSGRVWSVALSADGKRALSGSGDNTLKLWDLQSGEALQTLEGHSDWVWSVALSADGKRALSGSYDNTLKLWDLQSGEALQTLEGHSGEVLSVALSADGKRALSSGSDDNTLKVWDISAMLDTGLESGEALQTLRGHSGGVLSVALSADGKRALSGSSDNTPKVWDVESGEALQTLAGHSGRVLSMVLSGDGKRALSGSEDGTLKVWDVESGEALQTLAGHRGGVRSVALSGDGKRALSGSSDKTLKLWDLESGKVIARFIGESGILSCAITPDGKTMVAGERSGRVHFLRLEGGK